MPDLDKRLTERIREVREHLGLSQGDLAERLVARGNKGFQQQTIARIESGNRKVTYGEAAEIATSLGYSLTGLVGEVDTDTLVQAGFLLSGTENELLESLRNHVSSIIRYTRISDDLGERLRDSDRAFLDAFLSRQTPGRLVTASTADEVEAALQRLDLDPREYGEHLGRFVDSVRRDAQALDVADDG